METMDSNLAPPCKKTICSEESRNRNVGPNNFDVVATHVADWKDETLDAPEMNAMKSTMGQQSNNGDGSDGDRFTNLSVIANLSVIGSQT